MRSVFVLVLAAISFGPGCVLMKRQDRLPLDPQSIEKVKPGETTIAETAVLLGSPNEIIWSNGVATPIQLENGAGVINTFLAQGEDVYPRAYHYRYLLYKMSGFTVIVFSVVNYDTKYDDLYVFFDEEGVVTHVGASLDSNEASYYSF
jgi:hypothetical protein